MTEYHASQQVRAPRVENDAEREIESMCGENVANQLIGSVSISHLWQHSVVEYLVQIAIGLDEVCSLD